MFTFIHTELHQELDGGLSCCIKNFQKNPKPFSEVSKSQVGELVVTADQGNK